MKQAPPNQKLARGFVSGVEFTGRPIGDATAGETWRSVGLSARASGGDAP